MEQRRGIGGSERRREVEERAREAVEKAVHCRVRKIKRESGKIVDWWPDRLETRPHLREIAPSPLGLTSRAIAVGDS